MNGHPVDKIELLVLGGTWASYPHEYQASEPRAACSPAAAAVTARPRPGRVLP